MEKGMISVDALYENIQCLLPICNAMEKMLAENPLDSLRATENQREKRGMAATPSHCSPPSLMAHRNP
jgi:hypothetical protein